MRVLVLGGTGMLGHVVGRELGRRFDTYVTVRGAGDGPAVLGGVDARRLETVVAALDRVRPEAVVNCIGAIKQRQEGRDPETAIAVNAVFPHQLAPACAARGARLIHISTDCVYSGRQGAYRETDPPDPEDLYGRSKLLGEPAGDGCLTVRTSLIGRELGTANGLVEWFLAQSGRVDGYVNAIFSGITTQACADVLADVIDRHPALCGLRHVAGEPISKHDLLVLLREASGHAVEIEPVAKPELDRSLDASRFRGDTGWSPPTMRAMIARMFEEGL
jgi:dTDP-4-dehydrorhamnose reductase